MITRKDSNNLFAKVLFYIIKDNELPNDIFRYLYKYLYKPRHIMYNSLYHKQWKENIGRDIKLKIELINYDNVKSNIMLIKYYTAPIIEAGIPIHNQCPPAFIILDLSNIILDINYNINNVFKLCRKINMLNYIYIQSFSKILKNDNWLILLMPNNYIKYINDISNSILYNYLIKISIQDELYPIVI